MKPRPGLALAGVLLCLTACASSGQPTKGGRFSLFAEDYASWDHLKFSVKMSLMRFVGWQPVASPEEARIATAQGGWWGAEIPVVPEP